MESQHKLPLKTHWAHGVTAQTSFEDSLGTWSQVLQPGSWAARFAAGLQLRHPGAKAFYTAHNALSYEHQMPHVHAHHQYLLFQLCITQHGKPSAVDAP